MENIYTQAIADAKAVRESAMANAKAAIQEAFEPKIKAMLKKHIVENEEMDEMTHHEEDEMDETMSHEEEMDETEMADEASMEDPGNLDETSLDEILAELDALEEADSEEDETEEDEEDELDEATEEELDEAKKEEDDEEESEEDETEEDESEDGEESTDETKVVDITLGDLVDAIKSAMASETPAATEEPSETGSDDISLDEILAELEDEMDETSGSGDYMDEAKKKAKDKEQKAGHSGAALKAAEKETAYKKELEEANKAIETMRAELNEINLLNAKLLFVNKLFKAKSLTESQKVKILNAFDKATTIKEAKTTYNILKDSIVATPKNQLKESFGFASKPAGVAPKTNTMESDPFIARMQKLAGL